MALCLKVTEKCFADVSGFHGWFSNASGIGKVSSGRQPVALRSYRAQQEYADEDGTQSAPRLRRY